MPVRSTIQSSEVSTPRRASILTRSSLVRRSGGSSLPVPAIREWRTAVI